jgi:NADH:ubiquinone oxidoreductase subunit E
MEVQKAEVDDILNHWKRDKSNLIEMLEDVQEHYRYIPPQVAITIAGLRRNRFPGCTSLRYPP